MNANAHITPAPTAEPSKQPIRVLIKRLPLTGGATHEFYLENWPGRAQPPSLRLVRTTQKGGVSTFSWNYRQAREVGGVIDVWRAAIETQAAPTMASEASGASPSPDSREQAADARLKAEAARREGSR
jgi:hypothetical protein